MLNLAAAVERAADFDIIHYEAAYYPMSLAFARLSPTPIVQTLHHSPSAAEVRLWSRYPEAPFVAISNEQARLLSGLNVVGTVLHGIDTDNFTFREQPDDYLLFLGRFTEGKGVLQAIEIAKRVGMRLILAAAEDDYYREHGRAARRRHAGSSTTARRTIAAKVKLFGGARALLYPIQAREPFGLVLAEAMACGTPVAALDRGAVREVVDDGVTGIVFDDLEQMVERAAARLRARSPARARARGRAVRRCSGWSTSTSPSTGGSWRRIVAAHATASSGAAARRPHGARRLRAPRRRIARVRRDARAAGRRRRPRRRCCAPRAAKTGRSAIPRSSPDGDLGRVRADELREAAARPRRRRGRHPRSSRRRSALGRRARAARGDRRRPSSATGPTR